MDATTTFQVIGLRPDKTRFVVAHGLTRETANRLVNLSCGGQQKLVIEAEACHIHGPAPASVAKSFRR